MKLVGAVFAALLLNMSVAPILHAHPHIWIQYSIELVAQDDAITEIRLSWLLDPMFSSVLIGDHDRDGNGSFSAEEIKALQQAAFSNLREFDYFLYLRLDDGQAKPKDAENFSAAVEDKRLRYRFSIPLPFRPRAVEVSQFDETYFVALQPDREKPFTVVVDGGATPSCAAGEGKKVQGLISSFSPWAAICAFPVTQ